MAGPSSTAVYPALKEAITHCANLSGAAELIGVTTPERSINRIDCDPDAVKDFADGLKPALVELDEAVKDAERAVNELASGSDGAASDEAVAEAKHELEQLRHEREKLNQLIGSIRHLADDMDGLTKTAASEIVDIVTWQVDLAAKVLLTGSRYERAYFEQRMGVSPEDVVEHKASEVQVVAGQFENQLDGLSLRFEELADEAEQDIERGGDGD